MLCKAQSFCKGVLCSLFAHCPRAAGYLAGIVRGLARGPGRGSAVLRRPVLLQYQVSQKPAGHCRPLKKASEQAASRGIKDTLLYPTPFLGHSTFYILRLEPSPDFLPTLLNKQPKLAASFTHQNGSHQGGKLALAHHEASLQESYTDRTEANRMS